MVVRLIFIVLGLFGVSFIVSYLMQSVLIKFTESKQLYDYRDERKLDKAPRPRIGGFGIFMGFLVSIYCLILANFILKGRVITPEYIKDFPTSTVFLYVGAVMFVFILGLWDDFHGLKALPKLFVEISLASIFYFIGFKIQVVSVPFNTGQVDLGLWGFPVTVLWIVGVINAVNLIDGLDGLAGGVISFASLTIITILILEQQYAYALVLVPLLGGIAGFLPYNFYPSKIFMGDGGSLFAGVILSTIILKTPQKATLGMSLMVPLAILALPIMDTVLAFVRRLLKGRNPFSPDAEHIHHRFLKKGFGEKKAVMILLSISGAFSTLAILFYSASYKFRSLLVIIFFVIIIGVLHYLDYIKIRKRG